MLKLLLVAGIVFALLVLAEYMWRVAKLYTEITRKFVHITVGTFAAFWPWFLSWNQIEILSVAFFVVIIASRLLTIFSSIHLIGRKTIGELFFAAAIGAVAIITHSPWIYMAALLHLSVADGLAAVIGTWFGKRNSYSVFGQRKSIVGTLTFLISSVIILLIYFHFGHDPQLWPTIIWLPLATTVLENAGRRGSDNLIVPLFIAVVLRLI